MDNKKKKKRRTVIAVLRSSSRSNATHSIGELKNWIFFCINFTTKYSESAQFLTYLLHKQIIEMCPSQNLRCPFLVPSRRLCDRNIFGGFLLHMYLVKHLAKEQFGHFYTFWTMANLIFSPVSNSSHRPLVGILHNISISGA